MVFNKIRLHQTKDDAFLYLQYPASFLLKRRYFLMEEKPTQEMPSEEKKEPMVEHREMAIVKRRIPILREFLRREAATKHINAINRMIYFYRNFDTRFPIDKGDVFFVNFEQACGNEINNPHFCVALLNSVALNQMVTIVPLHSAKEGRTPNPASEVFLGQIPGVTNGKDAIALINQTRTIDKRRLFNDEYVDRFERYVRDKNIPEYQMIIAQHKFIYRLSDEQFRKLHKAVFFP